MENFNKSPNSGYIFGLTIVATLGGLLFGYDTAVINGAISALKNFFTTPLMNNPEATATVIIQYKILATICFVIALILLSSFLFKLFGKVVGLVSIAVLTLIVGLLLLNYVILIENTYSESVINSINGFTISSALVGCIIGGSIAGYISQSIGRKKGLIIAAILLIISALGSGMPEAMNYGGFEVITSFIIYRVIGGIGVGIASMLSPMYIAEVAPANIRGKLVSWNQFAIIFGMLVVYFVNYFIVKGQTQEWIFETGWRWMFLSENIPAVLFLVLLFFIPETPRFLVFKNKEEQARAVLTKLVGSNKGNEVLAEIKATLVEKQAAWLSFGGLILIIAVLLSVFQQFVGINAVLYYSSAIFENMGFSTQDSIAQTIIVGIINLTFTVIAILTVDKFGRKPLLLIGSICMAIGMVGLGTMFYVENLGFGALFFMLFYVAAFAISWGPVVWVLLSEIFPNSIRGAMSIAVALQWIANLVVSWTFPIINDNTVLTNQFHHGFSYWVYGVMGILSAIFVWKMVPETKGKTLENMNTFWLKKA
jgi:SP family xylose:H+ symportor-like MFS transporter